jgi:hypothetical protein
VKRKPIWPFLLLTLLGTSGCATDSTALVVSDYCRIAKPIAYDGAKDTPETVAEIEAHNSRWVCVCEEDCPVGTSARIR